MTVVLTLIISVACLWVYFLWSRRKHYAFALKMSGPLGFPLIGIGHKVYKGKDILYVLKKIVDEYRVKTFYTWFGPYPVVYTMDAKVAEIILNSPDAIHKSIVYDVFKDAVGVGLLSSKTPTWNIHRKLINPCFNYKVLQSFLPTFNELSQELCDVLGKHVDAGEVNIKEDIFKLGLKSSVATTMGMKGESSASLLKYFERTLHLTVQRALNPFHKSSILFRFAKIYKPFIEAQKISRDFVSNLVMSKIKQHGFEGNSQGSAKESVDIEKSKYIFIDQAIKILQQNKFTFNDVVSEATLMVVAGYETIATTLFSCIMFTAMHPEYQEKVYEEILASYPDKEFDVNSEGLKNLVYLDMVINEALRVTAPVPVIARECLNDLPISEGVVIPKGTQLIIDIFQIHRDVDVWGPDAKSFNPDHFLPGNMADTQKNSFLPFSKGPRNCIGWQHGKMSLKVTLAQVLRKYRFTTKFRPEDLVFVENLTLTYETTPLFQVHKR